ncbi:MAG: thiamine-binding protein [Flavobacteriaceae bacterium]|nr:MAG: thiamine-binding protein [Flavobacteriaceae bacterium]
MNISVDISMYPLHKDFEEPIIKFIKSLRASGLHVEENGLSTQVFGPYSEVMNFLNENIHSALLNEKNCVFVLKIVTDDRSNHAADY